MYDDSNKTTPHTRSGRGQRRGYTHVYTFQHSEPIPTPTPTRLAGRDVLISHHLAEDRKLARVRRRLDLLAHNMHLQARQRLDVDGRIVEALNAPGQLLRQDRHDAGGRQVG